MWCGGSRRGAVAGSSGRRMRCGTASSVLALSEIEPARTRAQKRVRAAQAAAKSAGAAADAGWSGLPPRGSVGEFGSASGAETGPGPGTRLLAKQQMTKKNLPASSRQGLRNLPSAGSVPGVSATVGLAQRVGIGSALARTCSISTTCPLTRRGGSRPLGAESAGARHEPRARRRAASVRATRSHKRHTLAVSWGLSMAASGSDCQSAGRRRNGVDHAGRPISYLSALTLPENLGLQPRPSQPFRFWPDRRRRR